MATLTRSDRTKVASVFFLIGIIGIVGIITYPSIPVFPDNEIVNEPVRVVEVAVQGEPREGEEPVQVEIVEIVEAEPVISGDHPQKELLRTTIDEFHAAFGSRWVQAGLSRGHLSRRPAGSQGPHPALSGRTWGIGNGSNPAGIELSSLIFN
mgnify:CR=1 FL=1